MRNLIGLLLIVLFNYKTFAQNIPSDSTYIIQDSIIIKARDGASLCITIVQKKGNTQPLPAILFYTTYYQGRGDNIFGKKSADRGYVGIVAYARGIRTNLQDYVPYEHDANDIYDIIDWISKQSWHNGKVGMYGGSYTGFAQWAATKKLHPALKTIVPQVAVAPGYDFPMENNINISNLLNWPNNILNKPRLPQDLNDKWYKEGTSFRSMDSLAGQVNTIFQKWLLHPAYDNYWKSFVPTPQEYATINIPILSTTGYYDGSQIGALHYLKQHYKYNKNANHYLVIGPYDHWGGQRKASANLMGYKIDSVANINMQTLAYEWLDHILKDAPMPAILKDKINYQVMGTNEWKHSSCLEKINNDTLTFYLSDKTLSTKKPKAQSVSAQIVDFKDRITQNNYFTPFIINDELNASNGLTFTTDAFKKDFTINGSFTGNLMATINKLDMDISIALYELMPDGKYFYLTRYLGRASYAKNSEKRQLLSPNKKENIPFDNTRFVSKQISKGSKLVIILNINKHPYEIVNYGSGKNVYDETINDAKEPLQIKWHNDSFIKVPILN